jgi:hypothetical protein
LAWLWPFQNEVKWTKCQHPGVTNSSNSNSTDQGNQGKEALKIAEMKFADCKSLRYEQHMAWEDVH